MPSLHFEDGDAVWRFDEKMLLIRCQGPTADADLVIAELTPNSLFLCAPKHSPASFDVDLAAAKQDLILVLAHQRRERNDQIDEDLSQTLASRHIPPTN